MSSIKIIVFMIMALKDIENSRGRGCNCFNYVLCELMITYYGLDYIYRAF